LTVASSSGINYCILQHCTNTQTLLSEKLKRIYTNASKNRQNTTKYYKYVLFFLDADGRRPNFAPLFSYCCLTWQYTIIRPYTDCCGEIKLVSKGVKLHIISTVSTTVMTLVSELFNYTRVWRQWDSSKRQLTNWQSRKVSNDVFVGLPCIYVIVRCTPITNHQNSSEFALTRRF
jgi:hypothetical protein